MAKAVPKKQARKPKRFLSEEGKERIRAAQLKRWKRYRAEQRALLAGTKAKPKKKAA